MEYTIFTFRGPKLWYRDRDRERDQARESFLEKRNYKIVSLYLWFPSCCGSNNSYIKKIMWEKPPTNLVGMRLWCSKQVQAQTNFQKYRFCVTKCIAHEEKMSFN